VIETFVAGEERVSSSPVMGPSVGAEVTPERSMFEAGRRALLPGVGCAGVESKFGTVFDL